jgi:hypothetical protein
MQLIFIASIGAVSFGALATCLIACFFSDEDVLKGARHGRYAYLGEDNQM